MVNAITRGEDAFSNPYEDLASLIRKLQESDVELLALRERVTSEDSEGLVWTKDGGL